MWPFRKRQPSQRELAYAQECIAARRALWDVIHEAMLAERRARGETVLPYYPQTDDDEYVRSWLAAVLGK